IDSTTVKVYVDVKDASGSIISDSSDNAFEIDSTLPYVKSTIPSNGAIDVGRTSNIVVKFSEEMNTSETQSSFMLIPNPGGIKYTWSDGNSCLLVETNELAYDTRYTCMVTNGAKDTCAGNHMANNYVWEFTTEKLVSPLKAELITPNGGSNECWAGNRSHNIYWSMSGGTRPYKVNLYYTTGGSTSGSNEWIEIVKGIGDSPYTWNVGRIDSTQVKVKVEVTDAAGKIVTDESNSVFEIDSTPPTVVSTTPANGISDVDVNIGTITVVFSEEMNTQQS
ncbi:MAG: Ig-like domain-containing protein, partial [bacterium]|nr:Ig-like domain-containing protein [bacterium]